MKLFLANLNKSTTEPQVEKFFDGYGQVTSMALKGSYGFVVGPFRVSFFLRRVNS